MTAQTLTRRRASALLFGGAAGLVAGCSTINPFLGRDRLLLASDDRLKTLGEQTWDDILRTQRSADEPGRRAELEEVGRRVIDAAGRADENWEFEVFDGPPNAFVLPGGKIGFFNGMYPHVENEAQLANVLGHEIGHLVARHAAERYSQQLLAAVGVDEAIAIVASTTKTGLTVQELAGVLGAGISYAVTMPYSHEHELEADRLGLGYTARAGYDPAEAPRFWTTLSYASRRREKPIEFISTHPADETRVAALQAEMPAASRAYDSAPTRHVVAPVATDPEAEVNCRVGQLTLRISGERCAALGGYVSR